MNFWFPSINARGDIASGNRDLWITYADGRAVQIADQGIGPLWLTDDTILYNDHVGNTRLWPGHDVIAPGYNQARTNGRGLWAGNNGTVVELYRERLHLESLNNSSVPRFDGDTLLRIVADPTDDRVKSVYRGTERLVTGAIMDYDGMPLVVTLATSVYGRVLSGTPTLYDDEGGVMVRDGWVMTGSTKGGGLFLRPIGEVFGYRLAGDQWYYPDFRLIEGVLIVAASTSNGQPRIARIPLSQARVDLRVLNTQPPIVTPPPPPVDPPKEPAVSLMAPNLIELIRQTMREHPEINTRDDAQRGRILDYAAAKAGAAWGRKSRNPQGTDLNSDAFCFLRPDGLFEIYDVISGGDGSATWDGFGPYRQGENGYWVPAQAIPNPGTNPPDVGMPPPVDADLAALKADLAHVIAAVAAHAVRLDDAQAQMVRLAQRIEQIAARPVPSYRVVGSTARAFGHSHQINVRLEPEP